jgi:hypothetical protein
MKYIQGKTASWGGKEVTIESRYIGYTIGNIVIKVRVCEKTKAIWKEQFREQLLNLSEEQRAKMWEKYLIQVRIKRNDIKVKNLAKRAKV